MKKKRVKKKSSLMNKLSLALIVISVLEIALLVIFIQQIPEQTPRGLDSELGSLSPTIGAFAGPLEIVPLETMIRTLHLFESINSAKSTVAESDMQITLDDGSVFDLFGTQYAYTQTITLGNTITTFGTSGGDLTYPIVSMSVSAPFYINAYNFETSTMTLEIENNGGQAYDLTNISISECEDKTDSGVLQPGEMRILFFDCNIPIGEFQKDITVTYRQIESQVDLYSTGTISKTYISDPRIYLDVGTTPEDSLYNYTLSFNRNLNVSDAANVQGQTIKIMDKEYIIGAGSTNTTLYLYGGGERITVSQDEQIVVTVGGADHVIELVTTSTTTTAKISVDGSTRTVTKGSAYSFPGDIVVYIQDVAHPAFQGDLRAVWLIMGAEVLKLPNGQTVKKGADQTSIMGTMVDMQAADEGVISGFTVSVAMERSRLDHILPGQTFLDPVFGGLGIEFGGVVPIVGYEDRERIVINTDNEQFAYVKFTRAGAARQATLTYAHDNETSTTGVQSILAHDPTNFDGKGFIHVKEGEKARLGDWIVINQGDQGTIVEVTDLIVDTPISGKVYLRDVITNDETIIKLTNNSYTYQKTANMFGGNLYNIEMTQDERYVNITWDDSGDAVSVFPRIKLENGGWIALLTSTLVDDGTAVIYPAGTSVIPIRGDTLHGAINRHEYYGITWLTRMNNGKYEIYGIDVNGNGLADCNFGPDKGPAILFLELKKWDDPSYGDFICVPLTTTSTPEIAIDDPVMTGENPGFFTAGDDFSKKTIDKYGTSIKKEDVPGENGRVIFYYPHTQMYMNISVVSAEETVDLEASGIYPQYYNVKQVVGRESKLTILVTNFGKDTQSQINLYADNILVDTKTTEIPESYHYTPIVMTWTPTATGVHTIRAEIIAQGDIDPENNFLEKEFYVYNEVNVTFNSKNSQNNPIQRYILSDQFLEETTQYPIILNGEKTIPIANLSENREKLEFVLYELYGYEEGESEFDLECGMGFVFSGDFQERIELKSEVYNKTTQDDITYYQVFAAEPSNNPETEYYYFFAKNQYLRSVGLENLSFGTNEWTLDGKYDFVYCRDFDFTTKQCLLDWQKAEVVDIDIYNNITSIAAQGNGIVKAFAITDFVGFDNSSTNFSLEQDIINNLTIIRQPYGKIVFKDNIDISRFRNTNLMEKHIRINNQYIRVDTTNLTELNEKRADIIFWNIDMHNPQLMYNGGECPGTICTNTAYDSSSKTFVANVNKFSIFTLEEGPYCGDGTCQSDEDCENCIDDCGCNSGYTCVDGVCESDDDGGDNGGSGGGDPYVLCVTSWNCTWSECVGGSQTLDCVDLSKCGTTKGRPLDHGTARNCDVVRDCIDNDGDGYGVGTDCSGPDIDDNDPAITDTLTAEDADNQDTQENPFESSLFYIIIALFIVAAVIAVFIIILVIINSSKKPRKRSNINVSESKREVRADF